MNTRKSNKESLVMTTIESRRQVLERRGRRSGYQHRKRWRQIHYKGYRAQHMRSISLQNVSRFAEEPLPKSAVTSEQQRLKPKSRRCQRPPQISASRNGRFRHPLSANQGTGGRGRYPIHGREFLATNTKTSQTWPYSSRGAPFRQHQRNDLPTSNIWTPQYYGVLHCTGKVSS